MRVGGGINGRSSQTPNRNPPGIVAPSYVTGDLFAEYDVQPADRASSSTSCNVTNKLYADSLYTGHYIPGAAAHAVCVDDGAVLTASRRRRRADAAPRPRRPRRRRAARARALLTGATWGDGRVTAGVQSAQAKNNQQLPQDGEAAQALQQIVLAALNRHTTFFSAALPKRVFPPLFNRYGGAANAFGNHVDNAVRFVPGGQGERVRTDISCTLFLAEPDEYDGGELVVEDTFGAQRVKLPAGDMVLYPGTSVHRVEPVTRGARLASFFWVESMVRSDEQRRLLFDMDAPPDAPAQRGRRDRPGRRSA